MKAGSFEKKDFCFNLRFPWQYYDSETGFYYNFHRYYMPEIGRYLREDEVRSDDNLYIYVKDNPVMGYDNSGFWGISFGPWAYVPPKPKIPDWCKCKRKRDEFFRRCVDRCRMRYPGGNRYERYGIGGAMSIGEIINAFLGESTRIGVAVIGWIGAVDYFLNYYTGRNLPEASDFAGWWYGCRIWCREILNDICYPDRWTRFGVGYHGFGYRRF